MVRLWRLLLILILVLLVNSTLYTAQALAPTKTPAPTKTKVPTKTPVPTKTSRPLPTIPGKPTVVPLVEGSLGTLAFISDEGSLNIVDTDGTNLKKLAQPGIGLDGGGLVWSPDGTQLAYVSNRGALTIMSADGSSPRTIVEDTGGPLVWSSDGKTLFARTSDSGSSAPAMLAIDVVTREKRTIYEFKKDETKKSGDVGLVSPDGKQMLRAYTPDIYTAPQLVSFSLLLIDLASGAETPLFDDLVSITTGAWSPDSTRLAVVPSSSKVTPSLGIYDLATKKFTPLVTDTSLFPLGFLRSRILWSADGTQLIYTFTDFETIKTDLFVINADGSHHRRLSPGNVFGMNAFLTPLAWRSATTTSAAATEAPTAPATQAS